MALELVDTQGRRIRCEPEQWTLLERRELRFGVLPSVDAYDSTEPVGIGFEVVPPTEARLREICREGLRELSL